MPSMYRGDYTELRIQKGSVYRIIDGYLKLNRTEKVITN